MNRAFVTQLQKARRPPFWLRIGAVVISLSLVVGVLFVERGNREAALAEAELRAGTMASALAQHSADTFQIADVALTSIMRLIGTETPTRTRLATIREDMAEHLRRVPRLSSLAYYEQSGWQLATSDRGSTHTQNQSESPAFDYHRSREGTQLHIGPPTRSDPTGPWILTASRRVSHADGSFGGILVATIKVEYFADFYTKFDEREGSRVVLMSASGRLLARNPYDETMIGLDLSDTQIFADIRNGPGYGKLRLTSKIDGVERLSSFRSVPGQSLTLIFSVSRTAALEDWRGGLPARSLVACGLILLVMLTGWRLARYVETRSASEANLLEISRTDALTGLLNRRAFDHVSQLEWVRYVESNKPLTFLMIDVDHFKAFNDLHGHQAGDECLQTLAAAIRDSIHFPHDRVMRYGGEEIAVVLPDTPSDQAFVVAERIRRRVEQIRLPFLTTPSPHVTVSIGYATEDGRSRFRSGHSELLADADRALYAAKVAGRNRVVVADELEAVRHIEDASRSHVMNAA